MVELETKMVNLETKMVELFEIKKYDDYQYYIEPTDKYYMS